MKPSAKLKGSKPASLFPQGQLRLELVDVYGTRLNQSVDILLRHQQLSDRRIVRGVRSSSRILIRDLHVAPQGLYRIEVDPPAYLPIAQFVNLGASGLTDLKLIFPVDTRKIDRVEFPAFQDLSDPIQQLLKRSPTVLGFEGTSGSALFGALDEIRKAGLLNVAAKAQSALLSNGKTVFPQVQQLLEVRGDRFFCARTEAIARRNQEQCRRGIVPGRGWVFAPSAFRVYLGR